MPESLLRRRDQTTLATCCLVGLAALAVSWVVTGGPQGERIQVDRAAPVDYRFCVDINRADWPELAQLPEIGEILARRIVQTRHQRGRFQSANDLLEVRGIGPRKLARITPYLQALPEPRAVVEKVGEK